jgi:multisubunit Na+/H+ antiporter MnhF subunit
MNAFLIASTALLVILVFPGMVLVTSRPIDAVVALQLCGTTITLVLLCLAAGFHQSVYFNVALVAAFCVWAGALIFVRFIGRYR